MTRYVITFFGKPYAIYPSYDLLKIFNISESVTHNSDTWMILWLINPGSEIAEILGSGAESMLGVVNAECLTHANQATSGMACNNPYQYEEISVRKVEAVLEFLKSDAYLFSLS